ncbi:MAG: sigma-70 family RNA polymerase sigma factor [Planctomycetes bacterium]|nr:sigma-70 family RNA polymerase sigma factor [Planctomycetota bacterium]
MPTRPIPPSNGNFDLARAIRGVRNGDRREFAALAERYYPRVREIVQRQLRLDFRRKHAWMQAAFSTGDVVQNVFLRVLDNLKDVRSTEEEAFLGYLAAAVKHNLLDALRHHRAERRDVRRDKKSESAELEAMAKAAPDRSPSVDAALREYVGALETVLESLSEKQRAIWEMRTRGACSWADIAAAHGYSSADVARQAFNDIRARIAVGLRRRGVTATRVGL